MNASIGIYEENLAAVAHSLGKLLADEYVLYTKTRKAHWCVVGADFYSKHLFFEGQYQQLEKTVDSVAERIRSLGHFPPATLGEFLALTHLSEATRQKNDSIGFITELLADHDSIIIHLRECINLYAETYQDAGTSDFITGILEAHEKMAWMLRAHLQ